MWAISIYIKFTTSFVSNRSFLNDLYVSRWIFYMGSRIGCATADYAIQCASVDIHADTTSTIAPSKCEMHVLCTNLRICPWTFSGDVFTSWCPWASVCRFPSSLSLWQVTWDDNNSCWCICAQDTREWWAMRICCSPHLECMINNTKSCYLSQHHMLNSTQTRNSSV